MQEPLKQDQRRKHEQEPDQTSELCEHNYVVASALREAISR